MSMRKDYQNLSEDHFFVFQGKNILVTENHSVAGRNAFEQCINNGTATDYFAEPEQQLAGMMVGNNAQPPEGFKFVPLRSIFAGNHEHSSLAARAHGLLEWRATEHFCRFCGSPLEDDSFFTARTCTSCKKIWFPQIAPCIIVLVKKEDKILLAKHVMRPDFYTCIAGFMEPGETAEECVAREVLEETGIIVKNVRYAKSQSWPFPNQLMLGFYAEYDSGEIRVQEDELAEALWFSPDELPVVPPEGSLAWELIHGIA